MPVDRFTGKPVDKASDLLSEDLLSRCDVHPDTFLINRCLRCGAPICCPRCCAESEAEYAEHFEFKGSLMTWDDIHTGAVVYHRIFTHFGKGIVQSVVDANGLELMFERGGSRRIIVKFEAHEDTTRVKLKALRSTPDVKRINKMIEFYRGRGVEARNVDGRLIIDRKEENSDEN